MATLIIFFTIACLVGVGTLMQKARFAYSVAFATACVLALVLSFLSQRSLDAHLLLHDFYEMAVVTAAGFGLALPISLLIPERCRAPTRS